MEKVWLLKMENGSTLECRADAELELTKGAICRIRRDFYDDLGEVQRNLEQSTMTSRIEELPQIIALADNSDLAAATANLSKAHAAMPTVKEWIARLNLEMNPVNAHYSLDCKLLTIQFCADGRIDFRELVKELSRALSTRIELRQIGVRDETGVYGGIAVCGQPLCCCRFLKEFSSINVKMAKDQDLSLTPASISGICGRLKCCLKYEHDSYLELGKGMLRKGDYCDTPSGRGRVIDRNMLTRKVTVAYETGSNQVYSVDEVTVSSDRRPFNSGSSRPQENKKQRNDEQKERGKGHHNKNKDAKDTNEGGEQK